MCGRIANTATPGYLRERFDEAASADILEEPGLLPRYNLTPGQFLPGLRTAENDGMEWAIFRWGLIPRWAKPDKIPDRTFNARSETAAEKPTFREAYKKRRCIIPISGYYEWTGLKGAKQPYYFQRKDSNPLLLAGLWETWSHEDTSVETCTILTEDADNNLGKYHHRMPVFLDDAKIKNWLHSVLNDLPHRMNTAGITVYPVSRAVNSGLTDHSGLIEKLPQLL